MVRLKPDTTYETYEPGVVSGLAGPGYGRRCYRFRRSHRGRQGPRGRAARHAARRSRRGGHHRRPSSRAWHRSCRRGRRDSRMRDARGGAGHERRADREPPRRHSRVRIRGDGESLLLVRSAGHRVRRRARDVRLRFGHRRGRHRVDEPGADGRPQDCAESDADGSVSRRLSEHRTRRREPRARVGHHARGAGPLRARQPSARDRGHRQRPLRRRNRARSRPPSSSRRTAQRRVPSIREVDVRDRRRTASRHETRTRWPSCGPPFTRRAR